MTSEKMVVHFLPPCPLPWIQKAAKLRKNGNAFKLAMFILYQSKITKNSAYVKISSGKAEEILGVDKKSFARTLNVLESLGMVSVKRKVGRSPEVKIIWE